MKNKKASVLVVSLIILGVILLIAVSISAVSVQQRKASISSSSSNRAYQVAESGVEDVLQRIKNNPGGLVSAIDNDGNCNGTIDLIAAKGYKVELRSAGAIVGCGAQISTIDSVKSTGTAGQDSRAIEAAVAQASPVYKAVCNSINSGGVYCIRMKISDGSTEERTSSNGSAWTTVTSPFPTATTAGNYDLITAYIFDIDAGTFPGVCRVNTIDGKFTCRYMPGASWTNYPSNGSPWP